MSNINMNVLFDKAIYYPISYLCVFVYPLQIYKDLFMCNTTRYILYIIFSFYTSILIFPGETISIISLQIISERGSLRYSTYSYQCRAFDPKKNTYTFQLRQFTKTQFFKIGLAVFVVPLHGNPMPCFRSQGLCCPTPYHP